MSELYCHYQRFGSGTPLILVHGIAASYGQWNSLIPDLTAAGFEVFAVDLLGHGNSARFGADMSCHIETMYMHLNDWIGRLPLVQRPIVIGHSLGGYLSLQLAMRKPEMLRGMLLVNPCYRPAQISLGARIPLANPVLSARLIQAVPERTIASILGFVRAPGQSIPEQQRGQMALDYKRADARVMEIPTTLEDLTPGLSAIRTPTVVMWGENDLTLDPGSFHELTSQLPAATGVQIPAGGHLPHLTQTDRFNPEVLNALRRL